MISFDVYAGTSQSITFELRDDNSQVLEDTTITVQLGLNTLNVDFNVPSMNDLELGISTGNSDLYRNSSGASYPYPIGNLASVTGHNSPWGDPEYHYFFYNIKMMENCNSEYAEATAVFMTPQSIEENSQIINVFPNPTSEYINIESVNNIDEIRIFDIQSRVVFSETINSKTKKINISNFSTGVYITEIVTNNIVIRKEFVISNDKTK